MSADIRDSIVIISFKDNPESLGFGTGFIIHKNKSLSYVLTCAHVIDSAIHSDDLLVDGLDGRVIYTGIDRGIDVAILEVEGLTDRQTLQLCSDFAENKSFEIYGFYAFHRNAHPLLRQVKGTLGDRIQFVSKNRKERISAWDLKINDNYGLEPGYSGSPVINKTNGCVLGIVSYRIGSGKGGVAISADCLKGILKDSPLELSHPLQKSRPKRSSNLTFSVRRKVERIERDIIFSQEQVFELSNLIKTVLEEINENRGNLVQIRNLKKKLGRYEEEKNQYEEKIENLYTEVESLTATD